MPRHPTAGVIVTYACVHDLTDTTLNFVYQSATRAKPPHKRQFLDIHSLESVVLWLASHGRTDLRRRILGLAAQSMLDDGTLPGTVGGAPHRAKRHRTSAQ